MGTFYLASLCLTGLIHANHGLKVMDYLSQEIKASESEVGMVVPWHEGGGGGGGWFHGIGGGFHGIGGGFHGTGGCGGSMARVCGGSMAWGVWWFHGTGKCGGSMARVGVVVP